MEMPKGFQTLNYLADNSLSVITINGYRLDQTFLKQTRNVMKEMYEALNTCVNGHANDPTKYVAAKNALFKFKEWGE